MNDFRVYHEHELNPDGHPEEWHDTIKPMVRELAGNRCQRCGHHYRIGTDGVWEPRNRLADDLKLDARMVDAGMEIVADRDDMLNPSMTPRRRHWSACDEGCTHGGIIRYRLPGDTGWTTTDHELNPIRHAVLRRGGAVQALWRPLVVIPLDGDKANCQWFNLAALCAVCSHHPYWELLAEDWSRTHVAGWTAMQMDGIELTPDEAREREHELIGVSA